MTAGGRAPLCPGRLPDPLAEMIVPKSTHSAAYWALVTRGLDFSDADLADPVQSNRIL